MFKESNGLKTFIPQPIRNKLILMKWLTHRFPFALHYNTLIINNAPLEQLIETLPTPLFPKVYWIDIKDIKYHGSISYPPKGRYCMPGDWDLTSIFKLESIFKPIDKGCKKWDLHETVRLMFLMNENYRCTPQYKSMMEAIANNHQNPPQGCRTPEEVDEYFEQLSNAFKSMQRHGYLTQDKLGKSSIGEIRLHITRKGELCLGTGGNHRIRMAEILGIKRVPIIIRGVHPLWIIELSNQYKLPPNKALNQWLTNRFHDRI